MMGMTEMRQYEYRCDGYDRDGRKCHTVEIVSAYNAFDADSRMANATDAWTGMGWFQTPSRGWLCPRYLHRDDPRKFVGFNPTPFGSTI